MNKLFCVYILTGKNNGVLYTGVTSNLPRRIWEHKEKTAEGFSKKYNLNKLVYYEVFENPVAAIEREKQIKKYRREKKIDLILKQNSRFLDLYDSISVL